MKGFTFAVSQITCFQPPIEQAVTKVSRQVTAQAF